MTPKQKEQFNNMLCALRRISKDYQTSEEIYSDFDKNHYGLDLEEVLAMAYDNMQNEATAAIKGIKIVK